MFLEESLLIANTFLKIDKYGMYYFLLPVSRPQKVNPYTTGSIQALEKAGSNDLSATVSLTVVKESGGLGKVKQDDLEADKAEAYTLGGTPQPQSLTRVVHL